MQQVHTQRNMNVIAPLHATAHERRQIALKHTDCLQAVVQLPKHPKATEDRSFEREN